MRFIFKAEHETLLAKIRNFFIISYTFAKVTHETRNEQQKLFPKNMTRCCQFLRLTERNRIELKKSVTSLCTLWWRKQYVHKTLISYRDSDLQHCFKPLSLQLSRINNEQKQKEKPASVKEISYHIANPRRRSYQYTKHSLMVKLWCVRQILRFNWY